MQTRFYFHEDYKDDPRCVLCGITGNIQWCGKCKEYFCRLCIRRYALRVAALVEKRRRQVAAAVR